MAIAVSILDAVTTLACAILLLRGYARTNKKLLLWSGLCFTGLTISNSLIFVDLVLFADIDLYPWRLSTAAISMAILLYGLIWESR
jgi:hypothetical protein